MNMFQKSYRYIMLCVLCILAASVSAQQKTYRDYIRSGNRAYRDSNYTAAEVNYRKALEANSRSAQAHFNLGNALLRQQKPKDAMASYEKAAKLETNKIRLSKIHHNMGVILQSQKQFGPAIECYKNALRNNPADNESRYNLALCQHQLKNNPQQDQNKNNDKDNKNGSGQNKNEDKKNDKKDQSQDKQKQQEKQKQQQSQSQNNDKMSKENAEQLLRAAMQDEKNTQERIKKAMAQPQRRRLEKQW